MTPADRPAGVGLSTVGPGGDRSAHDRRIIEAAVLGVMVFWAANFIVVKDVLSLVPPVGFTFLRYGLATLALLAYLRWTEGPIRFPAGGQRILLLGGVGFGLYQILWTVGLQYIPAGDSALLIAATPVFTAVIAVLIGTDTLTPTKGIGVALSVVGVVMVIAAGVGIELDGSPVGFALTVAAAVCWATYTAAGARVLRRHSPLVLTTWATLGGTLVMLPIGIGQMLSPGTVRADSPGDWVSVAFAVAFSGLLAAALANVVVFEGVKRVGPTHISTLQGLVPAMAVVLAFIFLAEPIRPIQVLGGAIIVFGASLTRRAQLPPAAGSPDRAR
jgi:drug/metabolite transporter (DMT)-like permease